MSEEAALTERETPRWKFWGTLLWGTLLALLFVVLQTVVVAYMAGKRFGADVTTGQILAEANNGSTLAYSTLLTALVCIPLIAGAIKLRRGAQLSPYLGLRPVPLRTFLGWLAVVAVYAFASDLFLVSFGRSVVPPFMSHAYATATPLWPLWLALVAGAPAFEEVFFRGFLLPGFERTFLGPVGAVIVTAVLWALVHLQYDAPEIAVIALAGLLLGAARLWTGSLYVPIAMHATINLVSTVETALLT